MTNEDQVRGKVKAGVGKLTGDEELERHGRDQERKGDAKEKLEELRDTVAGGVSAAKEAVREKLGDDDDRTA
ncbi:MAG: CsbD family protein [Actinomycetes bacterium]